MTKPATIGADQGSNKEERKEINMATLLREMVGSRDISAWLPWVLLATLALYLLGYVEGNVHGAVLGNMGLKLNYVHEAVHHARHLAFMCH